jgi:glycerol-3-phosphate acyltransferase PlsX
MLRTVRKKLDPRSLNGGVFLGLNGVVVKSHGSATAAGVANAVAVAARLLEDDLTHRISADLAELGEVKLRSHARAKSTSDEGQAA